MVKEQNLSVPTLLHPPGPGVVLGHPLPVVLQGEDARRGHDPRLAHAPAEGLAQFAGPAMKYHELQGSTVIAPAFLNVYFLLHSEFR